MINVFVSRANRVGPAFKPGLDGFIRVLGTLGLQPRTIGSTDYPSKAPLDEVIRLTDQCKGIIILGYPQIVATVGMLRDQPITTDLPRLSPNFNQYHGFPSTEKRGIRG